MAHARTCVLDHSQLFVYSQDSTHAGGLLFDSVYRVVKVTFDGHAYIPVDELTPHQMVGTSSRVVCSRLSCFGDFF